MIMINLIVNNFSILVYSCQMLCKNVYNNNWKK